MRKRLAFILKVCFIFGLFLVMPQGSKANSQTDVPAASSPAPVSATPHTVSIVTRIVPDVLDGQTVYPTNHATIALDPLRAYFWQAIAIPVAWSTGTYYFEVWDSDNEIVPGFAAHKLETNSIDIAKIDASLYPKIRLIIFAPPNSTPLPYVAPVNFTYTEQNNNRLAVFVAAIGLLFLLLLVGAVRYKITPKVLWRESYHLLRWQPMEFSLTQLVTNGWLTILWSGLFAVSLGTFISGIQILYLLIKLPFIFLAALLLSLLSNLSLSLLVGIRASAKEMIATASAIIATIAVVLATFSPIIIFYITVPQNHDQLLISTLFLVGLASVVGGIRFYKWTAQHTSNIILALTVTGVWFIIYGVVFLQLGWMMRPWVGVIDPVQHTVPFSRLYGGNVFEELSNTVQRL